MKILMKLFEGNFTYYRKKSLGLRLLVTGQNVMIKLLVNKTLRSWQKNQKVQLPKRLQYIF
jgi:hypothetical protein